MAASPLEVYYYWTVNVILVDHKFNSSFRAMATPWATDLAPSPIDDVLVLFFRSILVAQTKDLAQGLFFAPKINEKY